MKTNYKNNDSLLIENESLRNEIKKLKQNMIENVFYPIYLFIK
jgi:hypothetical protein